MADDLTSDAPTRSHDRRVAWSVVALTAATVLIGAAVPAPSHPRAHAEPSADTACAEWGDGCRVCQRGADGIACSLPGIACVPKEQSCLRRVGG
ncbi:hypothetical protein ACLBWX_00015 [Methylobacterium sp. M6A4_1b]